MKNLKQKEKNKISFYIPKRPMSWNVLYSQGHWAKRKKRIDEWHGWTVFSIKHYKIYKRLENPPFHIRFTALFKSRPIDVDNVCVKPIIDTMTTLGLIDDDTIKNVQSIEIIANLSEKDGIWVDIFETKD